MEKTTINLSKTEITGSLSRVRIAEMLILQLPRTHDGRNSWLLNYGVGTEAEKLRSVYAQRKKEKGYEVEKLVWNENTESLNSVS